MRVIGGSKRGFKLTSPPGIRVRPTADRVKEAMFNVLTPHIEGAIVLDLFAGTGALGIEALSRGATKAVFVDNHPRSVAIIRHNLAHCGFTEMGIVIRHDALSFLRQFADKITEPFNLVFMDPPYAWGKTDELLHLIGPFVLAPAGLVIVEHAFGENLPSVIGQLAQTDCRRYGDSELVFYGYGKGRS
jgi:16S rRNA (guanine966-N2)-methyltransferase